MSIARGADKCLGTTRVAAGGDRAAELLGTIPVHAALHGCLCSSRVPCRPAAQLETSRPRSLLCGCQIAGRTRKCPIFSDSP